jgi:hypothetical protein
LRDKPASYKTVRDKTVRDKTVRDKTVRTSCGRRCSPQEQPSSRSRAPLPSSQSIGCTAASLGTRPRWCHQEHTQSSQALPREDQSEFVFVFCLGHLYHDLFQRLLFNPYGGLERCQWTGLGQLWRVELSNSTSPPAATPRRRGDTCQRSTVPLCGSPPAAGCIEVNLVATEWSTLLLGVIA